MLFNFIVVGKTQEPALAVLESTFLKKASQFAKVDYHCVQPKMVHKDPALAQKEEAKWIEDKLEKLKGQTVLLDETGKQFSSMAWAAKLEKMYHTTSSINLVIGGAYGFSPDLKSKHNLLSLSSMTFTHDMCRVFLAEQLYRALTIQNNRAYHHQ